MTDSELKEKIEKIEKMVDLIRSDDYSFITLIAVVVLGLLIAFRVIPLR